MMTRTIVTLMLLALLLGGPLRLGAEEVGEAFGRQPIEISADRLEAEEASRQLRFIGNVVAKQGDVTIYGRELVVHYVGQAREIERVEVAGDVRIVQENRIATGDKGVFFNREGKIVLTGSPRVRQGEDFIEGDEITVFLTEEKSIVKGKEGARVKAVFHPRQEER